MQQDISQDFTKLNQQQQDMLRLFKSPMPEQDYNEVDSLLKRLLKISILKWSAWKKRKAGLQKLMNNGVRNISDRRHKRNENCFRH
jgi:hypothetical protein